MRKFLLFMTSLLLVVNSAPLADAHSTLVSSLPRKGTTLSSLPKVVTLTFNEKLLLLGSKNPNSISVASSSGESIATGPVKVTGNKISRALKSIQSAGRFIVTYRVVSADGHPISGEFFFTVK